MTVKRIQMIPPGYVDILHPETDSSVVLMNDGSTLEQFKGVTPQKTTADITYYVSTTGSDSNNGLASGTAFRTIQYAINKLPEIINHTAIINVANGTYNETANLDGFIGSGSITLTGNITTPTSVNVYTITVNDCCCYLTLQGFNTTSTTANSINLNHCNNFYISKMNMTTVATAYNGVAVYWSTGIITACVISNKNRALYVGDKSSVMSSTNTGSGNTSSALYATNASTISAHSTQPTGAIADSWAGGSKIIYSNPIPSLTSNGYRYNDDGTLEQWGVVIIPSTAINVSTSATWTYPIPFATCFNVSASFNPTASHFYTPTSCFASSGTQAKAYVTNGGTTAQGWTVTFRAIGIP